MHLCSGKRCNLAPALTGQDLGFFCTRPRRLKLENRFEKWLGLILGHAVRAAIEMPLDRRVIEVTHRVRRHQTGNGVNVDFAVMIPSALYVDQHVRVGGVIERQSDGYEALVLLDCGRSGSSSRKPRRSISARSEQANWTAPRDIKLIKQGFPEGQSTFPSLHCNTVFVYLNLGDYRRCRRARHHQLED